MPSFSNILQSIKNLDAPATTTPNPVIKKIKIANNGSHAKDMSDVVEAASKRTAPVIQQQAVGAALKANLKKRKADDTGTFAAKPKTKKPKTKTTVENVSLERRKEDALVTLEGRRCVAQLALDGLLPFVKKSEAIETAVAVLEQQIEDHDLNIKNLRLFVRALGSGKIKSTDLQTLLTPASWGLEVKTAFEDVSSSQPVDASDPVGEEKARTEGQ